MKISNFLLFIFVFTILSCKKNTDDAQTVFSPVSIDQALLQNNLKVDGNISITSSNFEYNKTLSQIDIQGFFHDATGKNIKIDDMNMNGYTVLEQSNGFYYQHFMGSSDDGKIATTRLIGKDIDVVFNSSILGNISTSVYAPQYVQSKIDNLFGGVVLKNEALSISWIPDNKGTKVAVIIFYNGKAYPNKGNNLPEETISTYKLLDDADGRVRFSAAELAKFPIGGSIRFFVGRATQNIVSTSTGKKVAITCLSHSFSDDYELK